MTVQSAGPVVRNTPDAQLLGAFGGMGAETLDLTFCSLDHRFEVGDEFLVHRVVGGPESIEGGCAGSVKNPEHGQVFVRVSRHLTHEYASSGSWNHGPAPP